MLQGTCTFIFNTAFYAIVTINIFFNSHDWNLCLQVVIFKILLEREANLFMVTNSMMKTLNSAMIYLVYYPWQIQDHILMGVSFLSHVLPLPIWTGNMWCLDAC